MFGGEKERRLNRPRCRRLAIRVGDDLEEVRRGKIRFEGGPRRANRSPGPIISSRPAIHAHVEQFIGAVGNRRLAAHFDRPGVVDTAVSRALTVHSCAAQFQARARQNTVSAHAPRLSYW